MVSLGVDVSNIEPQAKFELVPPGTYKIRLIDAVEKPTKAGTGNYINLTFEVLEPAQYAGAKIFDRLNLDNPSDKARAFAQRRLAALVRACGLVTAADTEQLLMKPLMVDVIVEKSPGYDDKNTIKNYLYDKSVQPAAPAATEKPAAAANAPVWART